MCQAQAQHTWSCTVNAMLLRGSPQVPVHKHMWHWKQPQGVHTGSTGRVRRRGCTLWTWIVWIHGDLHWSRWLTEGADGSRSGWVQQWVSTKDWLMEKRKLSPIYKSWWSLTIRRVVLRGEKPFSLLLKGQNGGTLKFGKSSGHHQEFALFKKSILVADKLTRIHTVETIKKKNKSLS